MSSTGVAYLVFILPIALSLFFGSVVMADIVKKPDRELNMWPFEFEKKIPSSEAIKIIGLQNQYSISEEINIQVSVDDRTFDCGDLYITIYRTDSQDKQVISQSGFFNQCFGIDKPVLPFEDEFSESIDIQGMYEIVAEMNDKPQSKTISSIKQFIVQ